MMLLGALSYALPSVQEFSALFPCFSGIVIAGVGIVILHHPKTGKLLMNMNIMAALLILIWMCLKVVTDALQLPAIRCR